MDLADFHFVSVNAYLASCIRNVAVTVDIDDENESQK